MANQPSSDQSAPTSNHHTIRVLAAAAIGTVLLVVSGLTLTGTVICLIIATPLLVLFSPVLVPGGILMFLAATGFLVSSVFGVAALSALSWIYNYVTGKYPPGSEKLDYARMKMANKAKDLKERAKEHGQYVQSKTQEAAAANAANQGGQMQSANKTQEAAVASQGGTQATS